ncbi:hypothetical protein NQ317_011431 [Molorchus minor]|uniref:Beta-hexosaminidase n=1 Tax=Molorchus minor TaxID=1323400 RepID=A0ABQ9JQN7_9CUCU|nr:hypothetical protein NQ317_011431 [Molorchus minor]
MISIKTNMIVRFICVVLVVLCSDGYHGYIVDPGPTIKATKGEVWPKPQSQDKYDSYFVVRPQVFEFKVLTENDCSLLENAFSRYHRILSNDYQKARNNFDFETNLYHKKLWLTDDNYIGYLDTLNVYLFGPCEDNAYPTFNMSEDYLLVLSNGTAELSSNSTWGILRGLETFSQLTYLGEDTITLRINSTLITDYPRFAHRGLLLDTARHYIPLDKIITTLDAMSYNKMNVFSLAYHGRSKFSLCQSKSFQNLELQTRTKWKEKHPERLQPGVLVFIKDKNLPPLKWAMGRVLEVHKDADGHTRSWGVAKPELLTECYDNETKTGKLGPIDPTKNNTYSFLKELFEEIGETFPDQYIHLGGDEVGFECWESNSDINAFMKANDIVGDYSALESYYIQKLINIVDQLNSSSIVWEEVFSNGVILPNKTIVHVWKDNWQLTIYEVTESGRNALLSSCWYLDHLASDGDWLKFYACDPYDFVGTEEQKQLVIGGEACMWSEVVNQYNVISRVWPRASATAEKLWSDENASDILEASRRLEEHTCRMNARGIGAQPPNSAGYCL